MKRLLLLLLLGCGDSCERLCRDVALRLEGCIDESTTWVDFGARSRSDFIDQCQSAWSRTQADLTNSDLGESVEICMETRDLVQTLSCAELRVLYLQ